MVPMARPPLRYDRTPWGARYVELKNTEKTGIYEYHETHAGLPLPALSAGPRRHDHLGGSDG